MRLAAALLLFAALVRVHADEVIVLPGSPPLTLRIDVEIDGQAPAKAWDVFLGKVFEHFDRNGDHRLDKAELARVFPLPVPGRKDQHLDFTKLDADKSGDVGLAEFKTHGRDLGFGPAVLLIEPPARDDATLAAFLHGRLDTDRDGKLSEEELHQARSLLGTLDLDDDERLDLAEAISAAPSVSAPPEPAVKPSGAAKPDAVLRIQIGRQSKAALDGPRAPEMKLTTDAGVAGLFRMHGPKGQWTALVPAVRTALDMKGLRKFLIAQFDSAIGDRPALTRAEVMDDLTLSGLEWVLAYADRDGDERLTRVELERYLDLLEMGVRTQLWIRIADRGRNPFPLLDADGDGKLDVRELGQAAALLGGEASHKLPRSFRITLSGPAGLGWGGILLPASELRTRPAAPAKIPAPPWFTAMDKNGDAWLSPREFLGPVELFRKLDMDGNGLIGIAEAMKGGK